MVRIPDIARAMGLSVSTVYKAFNGGKDINENTRAEILKTAARMGYVGKPRAFSHKRVCVFLEHMEYPIYVGSSSAEEDLKKTNITL